MKIFFLNILICSQFSERKKSILMKMNPPGSFSMEGKKKISKRGSGCGVTPLEKLGKEKNKSARGVRGSNGPRKERKKSEKGVRGSRKLSNPSRRKEKQGWERG